MISSDQDFNAYSKWHRVHAVIGFFSPVCMSGLLFFKISLCQFLSCSLCSNCPLLQHLQKCGISSCVTYFYFVQWALLTLLIALRPAQLFYNRFFHKFLRSTIKFRNLPAAPIMRNKFLTSNIKIKKVVFNFP